MTGKREILNVISLVFRRRFLETFSNVDTILDIYCFPLLLAWLLVHEYRPELQIPIRGGGGGGGERSIYYIF